MLLQYEWAIAVVLWSLFCTTQSVLPTKGKITNSTTSIKHDITCTNTFHLSDWWTYEWCDRLHIRQIHLSAPMGRIIQEHILIYTPQQIENTSNQISYETPIQYFFDHNKPCEVISDGINIYRTATVQIQCCKRNSIGTFISSVHESEKCKYSITICSEIECDRLSTEDEYDIFTSKIRNMNETYQLERVRAMFYHAFNGYFEYAYPYPELQSVSCTGGQFDLIKIPLVTLIDAMDTLVVMGDHANFRRSVQLVLKAYPHFNLDVNVSVFETTIRILGGLLSAHLLAIDPALHIYSNIHSNDSQLIYSNGLLHLAVDLGNRLMEAFYTDTGIPIGTVNLMSGVPEGETEIASTAGAGSLLLEFQVLSILSGDVSYGDAAYAAVEALYNRRSTLSLVGKHIHTGTGVWTEDASGVGSNADSFFEYLLKGALLFPSRSNMLMQMFAITFIAVKQFIQKGDWMGEVDMTNGLLRRMRSENLQAFWPGMESMMGLLSSSASLLNAFYSVWSTFDILPEEFESSLWMDKNRERNLEGKIFYPLRPELIESTYYQYRATLDKSWLVAGSEVLDSIETHAKTRCGYAGLTRSLTGSTMSSMSHPFEKHDSMPSFFLSETCKYLYLLFDEHNFVHNRSYIFSTEAHLIDIRQLQSENVRFDMDIYENTADLMYGNILTMQCLKPKLWDTSTAYQPEFSKLRHEFTIYDRKNLSIFDPVKIGLRKGKYCELDAPHDNIQEDVILNRQIAKKTIIPHRNTESLQPTVDVDVPGLGKFRISLLGVSNTNTIVPSSNGGYRMHSLADNRIIELSSVGLGYTYIGEYISDKLGNLRNVLITSQYKIVCKISIEFNHDDVDPSVKDIFDRQRYCAMALFGPTALADQGIIDDISIDAEVVYLQYQNGCDDITASKEGDIVIGGEAPKAFFARWWSKSRSSPKTIRLRDKIVIVKRGDCSFQDKAENIEKLGARVVIIENNGETLFVMAGKDYADPLSRDSRSSGPSIPTVMLTYHDSQTLLSDLQTLRDKGIEAKVRLRVSKTHVMHDWESLGDVDYPKGIVTPTMIAVASSGVWAVTMRGDGGKWQVTIFPKHDTSHPFNPWDFADSSGNTQCSYRYGSLNEVEIYRQTIYQQCPLFYFDEQRQEFILSS